MPLNLVYTIVQKSQKWPKTQIKGGPALNLIWPDIMAFCQKKKGLQIQEKKHDNQVS